MIKTILTVATGADRDAAVLAAALAIARPLAAHLDVLHVRFDAATIAMAMATDSGSGALSAGLIDRLEQDATTREATARANFTQFCQQAGLAIASAPDAGRAPAASAQFHVETGEQPRWVATYGLAADLIVAPRGNGDEASERAVLEAVLIGSGRPLVIPTAAAMPEKIERIAIAWKPVPQAARAVALAMPLLAQAQQVVVLTVEEPPERPEVTDATDRLLAGLAWHGLAVRGERLPPGPEGAAATLLAAARDRAELLVMGGYGHSRWREWAFGGITQQVLANAPLPVLIAH